MGDFEPWGDPLLQRIDDAELTPSMFRAFHVIGMVLLVGLSTALLIVLVLLAPHVRRIASAPELPLGEHTKNASVSVTLATNEDPLLVDIVGPAGPECSIDDALCVRLVDTVTLAPAQPLLNVTVVNNITLAPHQPTINTSTTLGPHQPTLNTTTTLGPHQPTLNASCTLDEPIAIYGDVNATLAPVQPTLNVTLTGPYADTCSPLDALCVKVVNANITINATVNVATHIFIANETLAVAVTNELTLAPEQPTLNVSCELDEPVEIFGSVNAACTLDEPIDVLVINEISLGPSQPTLNCSLDEPVDVTVLNALTLAPLQPTLNCSLDEPIDVEIVGPLGARPSDESVSVVIASDQASVPVRYDVGAVDVFARLRISELQTLFDIKMLSSITDGINFDNAQVSGAGTSYQWVQQRASVFLNVSAATAGRRVRQSLRHFNYQPGKGQLIMQTLILHDTPAGVIKRWGYYDDNNGAFWEYTGNRLFAVERTATSGAPIDTRTDVTDRLPPGWSHNNGVIYVIEFAWLGVGQSTFSLFNDTAYTILYENEGGLTVVNTAMPNQPVRYEIINNGTGPASALECICVMVGSEGGAAVGVPVALDRGASLLATVMTDGLLHSVLAVRLNPTEFIYAAAHLTQFGLSAPTGNVVYYYQIVYRPTMAGAALTWLNSTNSPLQYAIPVLANTLTGGYVVASGYVVGTAQSTPPIPLTPQAVFLGSLINGTPLELHLAVQRLDLSGGSDSFYGSLGFITVY